MRRFGEAPSFGAFKFDCGQGVAAAQQLTAPRPLPPLRKGEGGALKLA